MGPAYELQIGPYLDQRREVASLLNNLSEIAACLPSKAEGLIP
ncbi:MAG: hypothetical protein ACI8QC_004010 [Planctomycetota bacterium]|jgi:hypothetical protein